MKPRLSLLCMNLLLGSAMGAVAISRPSFAEDARPTEFQSQSIRLRTDLEPTFARQLCEQLEQTVEQLATEFGKPLAEPINVLVVKDLATWPAKSILDDARKQIEARAGTTITERLTKDGTLVSIRSTVFSVADGRTPQHELVHAYCWQTFGRVGPDWFAEGMAELFANRRAGAKGVQAPGYILDYLRTDPSPPTPEAIVTDQLGERKQWQKYAHRWALCYLLTQHLTYADQFRQFSRALLNGKDLDFQDDFAGKREKLHADYRQFMKNISSGYEFPKE